MPIETVQAIEWALTHDEYYGEKVTKENASAMVDLVREYFNSNAVEYGTFSYDDLLPFLN